MAFTGTVEAYLRALYKHNEECEECAPGGLPKSNDARLCTDGRKIRDGLAYARGREAGQTGAKL